MNKDCNLNINIIDDDIDSLNALEYALETLGHTVHKYHSPVEALSNYKKEKTDLVITDYKMPEMTGTELLKSLKKIDPDVNVIIVTAYGDFEMAQHAINNDALYILTKPINLQNVDKCLKSICKKIKNETLQIENINMRLAELSHDIRNPLNAMINFAEILQNNLSNKTQIEYIETIKRNGENLRNLLTNIMGSITTKYDKTQLNEAEFNLKELIIDVFKLLNINLENKQVNLYSTYNSDVPENFIGCPIKIRQLLINLIGNSVKFTNEGEIEVSVNVLNNHSAEPSLKKNENIVQIAVRDTGIGIPAEKQKSIFNSFEQADSTIQRNYGGTGLGLFIVKTIVNKMGGNILVESEEGIGSKFVVNLKLQKVEVESKEINSDSDHKPEKNVINKIKKKKILVCEDSEDIGKTIELYMKKYVSKIKIVKTGMEAVIELEENSYDMCLMDLNLPVLNGVEAAKIIRRTNLLPIIVMSGYVSDEIKEQCLSTGINEVINKPFSLVTLKAKIEKYF